MISALRRRLRTLADLAVAIAVTLAPVLFPRALDDPHGRQVGGDEEPRSL
ncbi:hypothetical protein GCM10009676_14940 [Prauserella halophila]|uniref:Uncharacterized protein n=1 Tax=Prauserella halophila TaxID=185641 RepID=A0ABN1W4V8_9PSEU|nr:hypothetical protein [Prauserella halophila]MCP2236298.1 hypothetical protein [Prauserella halophila]